MAISKTDIAKLYIAMFDRAPEGEGLDYWYGKATNGESLEQIANEMASAAKAFPDDYPQYANYDANDAASVKAVIDAVYKVLFNKDSSTDPEGVNHWVEDITSGRMDLGTAIVTLEKAAEEYLNSDDEAAKAAAETFVNRADVAVKTADSIKTADINGDGKIDSQDFGVFQNIVKTVTNDETTVEQAQSLIKEYTPVSLDLTTGKDTIEGSKAADTFNAPLLTLNDGDSIDGKDGVDTLNVEITNNVTDGVTVKNVENVNVTAYGARTINMKNFTGVENFTDKDSTGTLTLNNVNNNMKLAVEGTSVGLTANFTASALQGSADTLDVTLKEAKSGNVTVNAGFENAKLHVDGNSTLAGLTVPGVNTLVTDGSGDLTVNNGVLNNFSTQVFKNDGKLTLGNDTVTTLSAQNNTAGVVAKTLNAADAQGNVFANSTITLNSNGTVLLGSGDDNVKIQTNGTNTIRTGDGNDTLDLDITTNTTLAVDTGAGDDLVQVKGNTTDNTDVINLGDGNDVLRISDANAFAATLKGVESLHIYDGGTAAVNLTNADSVLKTVTYETVTSGDDVTINNMVAGSTLNIINYNSASPASFDNLTVGWKATEPSSTIKVDTKIDGTGGGSANKIDVSKVTDLTLELNDTVGATNAINVDAEDSASLTINAKKAATFGDIVSTSNKTETLKITGSDLVTTGNLTSTALKDVEITAEKALTVGTATNSAKLNSVKYTSNTNTVDFGNIGTNNAELSEVTITGAKNVGANNQGTITAKSADNITIKSTGGSVDFGNVNVTNTLDKMNISAAKNIGANNTATIDAATLNTLNVSSTEGAVTLGAIDDNTTNGKIGTIDVSAKTNVTLGAIGDSDESLESLKVTATQGYINLDGNIDLNDSDGVDLTLTANTLIWNDANSNGQYDNNESATVTNSDGNIGTVTLSGNAKAYINFTVDTKAGAYVENIDASGLKGGLTTTITNNDTLDSVSSSTTVSLGAKDNNTSNSVTFTGKVDSISVNGSDGKDTIKLGAAAGDTIKSGTISLGAGTDKLDLTNLDGIKTAADGAVINLSSSSQTVGSGSNQSTVSAGKIVEFDGSKVVDGGYSFTVSGVDQVTGTNDDDIIYAANTGTTITGGAGNDTIHLGAGTDTVKYDSTTDGSDTISDFTAGTDILAFNSTNIAVDGGATTSTDVTSASAGHKKVADQYEIIKVTDSASADWSNVLSKLSGAVTLSNGDSNDQTIFLIDNGADTRVYYFDDTSGTNTTAMEASELHLLATLTGVSDVSTISNSTLTLYT